MLVQARNRFFPPEAAPAQNVRAGASLLTVWLALGTVYVLWGSTYLGIKLAIATMPPLLMGAARFLTAGALLFLFAIRRGDWTGDRVGTRQWVAALAIGSALLLGGNGGVILAERTVPTGIVALLVAASPLWMAVINRLAFKRKLSPQTIVGLLVGFAGVGLLIGMPGDGHIDPLGGFLAVLAPICWAAGSVYARHVPMPKRPLVGTAMQMICGGVLFAVAGILAGEPGRLHLGEISVTSWLALAYLVVFGSLVGFTYYAWLLRAAPLPLVSTYAYVNPVIAVLLGWLFLAEPLSLRTFVAGGVVVLAVALIVSARMRPLRARPAAPSRG
jgi:drug/metabolite transporter (DMT)-like permease